MPSPPPSLPGVVAFPPLARAATRLGLTLREVDERLSVEDVLDEADLAAYLHDVDVAPQGPSSGQTTPPTMQQAVLENAKRKFDADNVR